MDNITSRLIKGTAWLSLARVFINALSILSTFVLARLLAPDDFGLVALATTLMLLVGEVTELSLAQALVRHPDPTRTHFDTAWTLNALRGMVLGGAFAASSGLVGQIYGDPRLVGIMLALGASIFISGLANPRRVLLTRKLIFWQEFILNVGQKLAGVVASIVVACLYHSYWALVIGILVTQVANIAISYMVLPFVPRPRFAHARELFSFSLWVTAARVVDTLNWRFDILFVGKLLGSTALGHYSMGSTLASIPTRETTGPLRQTFFPAFASMRDDDRRMAAAYQRAQAVVTAVALPAGFGAALIADPLIRLVMGEKWAPAIFIVQALAAVYALQTLGSSVDSIGMAKGQTRLLFIRSLQMLLVRIPVIAVATLLFGMAGLVASRVFTGLLAALVNMFVVRKLIGVGVGAQFTANRRALLSAASMLAVTWVVVRLLPPGVGPTELLVQLAVIALAVISSYGLATWALWTAAGRPAGPEQELQQLVGKVWRKVRSKAA